MFFQHAVWIYNATKLLEIVLYYLTNHELAWVNPRLSNRSSNRTLNNAISTSV